MPRNLFLPVYSQHTIKVFLFGEWEFLNILSLYLVPLIRSLSWNRLKSPRREIRTQANTLLHLFACIHARTKRGICESYHGGSARKLRLFVSPQTCLTLLRFPLSTNLFLPALPSFFLLSDIRPPTPSLSPLFSTWFYSIPLIYKLHCPCR